MFKQRLISGIILVMVMLALFIVGDLVLWAGMLVVSCIGIYELQKVFVPADKDGGSGALWNAFYIVYPVTAAYYFLLRFPLIHVWEGTVMLITFFVILLLGMYVFAYPKIHANQVMAAFFSFFYVAMMLSYIYLTRQLPAGAYWVWLIILYSWGSDTCAYCVGVLFGKHKMAPVLSPKKSIEGAVGGVLGACLLSWIYCSAFKDHMGITQREVILITAFAAVGALISMIGDLAASAIKRNFEIKDYGTLIPGHGGILDRFDSVIITAPIIYYLLLFGVV